MRQSLAFLALLLATPAVAANQAATSVRSTSFTYDAAGGMIVTARVNGEGPFRFLLDTGSARTAVSASLAGRTGAALVAKSRLVSGGASAWVPLARLASLSIGVAGAVDLDAVVIEDRRLRQTAGAVDGIAGQDFLSRFNYLIDRERQTMLWNPTPAERPAGGNALRLLASEGRFLVELPQKSGERLTMVPDSGADSLVIFPDGRAARLLTGPAGGEVMLVSLAASRAVRRVKVARLDVGAEVRRNVPAVLVSTGDTGSDGLLPLRGYRQVLFDSAASSLTLWP